MDCRLTSKIIMRELEYMLIRRGLPPSESEGFKIGPSDPDLTRSLDYFVGKRLRPFCDQVAIRNVPEWTLIDP